MEKRFLLAIAISASLASFGTLAAEKPSDQSSSSGAASNSGSASNGSPRAAEMGGYTFGDLDRDGDDKVSWAEANMDPAWTVQFPQYDRDGDGFITSAEFGAVGGPPGGGASNSEAPSDRASSGNMGSGTTK